MSRREFAQAVAALLAAGNPPARTWPERQGMNVTLVTAAREYGEVIFRQGFQPVSASDGLGADAEEAVKALARHGIPQGLGKLACEQCHHAGKRFTVLALVDALTRMNRDARFAGDRTEADFRAASLLDLVADPAERVALLAA